jgi:hypothetical protein
MIGEMRDRETMLAGIQAAETGHLVFATLHTADTMQSFARILEFFDTKDHAFIRSGLAAGLRGVLAQRLIPCVREGVQRVPATEVLLNNSTVADKIREGEDEDLPAVLQSSEHEGMHTFTLSLAKLVDEELRAQRRGAAVEGAGNLGEGGHADPAGEARRMSRPRGGRGWRKRKEKARRSWRIAGRHLAGCTPCNPVGCTGSAVQPCHTVT